jgi:ABC-2 type transport system ATP-binding protein
MEGVHALVEVQEVSRSFGSLKVLTEVSLDVHSSTMVALLGPSGAGKTTLVRMIAGVDTAPTGRVLVDGGVMPSMDRLPMIGYMAQSDALYLELSGRENLEFFGSLYSLEGTALTEAIDRTVKLVDLGDAIDRPVLQYSGGMKRRLSLATSLLHNPKVLILDEPTVGLDPVLRHAVWKELRAIADRGAAILVTTHVMDEADQCDIVCMLRDGRIIAKDTPADLMASAGAKTMQDAFLHYATVEM